MILLYKCFLNNNNNNNNNNNKQQLQHRQQQQQCVRAEGYRFAGSLTSAVNLFASGRAPEFLRRFIAGGVSIAAARRTTTNNNNNQLGNRPHS